MFLFHAFSHLLPPIELLKRHVLHIASLGLQPKTIADLMQYKRWVAHNGVMLDEFVAEAGVEEVTEEEISLGWEYGDDEGNEVLVGWLKEWEAKNTVASRLRTG